MQVLVRSSAHNTPKPRRRAVRKARQARSRHTVETILEGAARVLGERGWASFTTNAVAERAGVSIGSLYEYFRDKGDLVNAIADRHLEAAERILQKEAARWDVSSNSSLGAPIDANELIAVLVDGFVGLHAHDPLLHRVLSSQVPLSGAHQMRRAALNESVIATVTRLLPPHIERPERTARMLTSITEALTHAWIVEGSSPLPEAEMRQEIKRVLRAYLETGIQK